MYGKSESHWLNACPAVGSHLQESTDGHAQPDASSITQQYIQYYLIPPALCKVWQQVHEEQLWKQRKCMCSKWYVTKSKEKAFRSF